MKHFLAYKLHPQSLEDQFRESRFVNDREHILKIIMLSVLLICGFTILDYNYLVTHNLPMYLTFMSRGTAAIFSLITAWRLIRHAKATSFNRIVFVWAIIIASHIAIISAIRPGDYISLAVWDIILLFGLYTAVPIHIHLQMRIALLFTLCNFILWIFVKQPSWTFLEYSETFLAYISANIIGIFLSNRYHVLQRQQFVLLYEEQVAKRELEAALNKIKVLQGIIPICASCKKIRDDKGYWKQIEEYIRDHSDADFSHGLCPDCAKTLYPDYYPEDNK